MYNRCHNYAATQLRRINENNRFCVPRKYQGPKILALSQSDGIATKLTSKFPISSAAEKKYVDAAQKWEPERRRPSDEFLAAESAFLQEFKSLMSEPAQAKKVDDFLVAYDAAWDKLDDDLFNTARL